MNAQPVETLLSKLEGVHRSGSAWTARCPTHDDKRNSLSIGEGDDGRALVKCHAGCDTNAILDKLGLGTPALFPEREGHYFVESEYEYRDAGGAVRYVVERRVPKDFRQRRPDGAGGWIRNLEGVTPLPYRLPELLAADPVLPVVVVEGEKDADRLTKAGFVASCNSGGAGKWRSELTPHFAGRRVVIIPDNDDPGRQHAAKVEAALRGVAASVAILDLPNLPAKGDVSEWLKTETVAELWELIERTPQTAAPADGSKQLPTEIVTAEDLAARVLRLYDRDEDPGIFVGWSPLRDFYRPRAGELTVGTGAPNAGKSTFFDALMVNTATGEHSWRWLVFSPEYVTVERHVAKLLQKITDMPFREGPSVRMTKEQMRTGLEVVSDRFTFIDPSRHTYTLEALLDIAARTNAARKHDGFIIDPYNVIAATSRPKNLSEHEFINEVLVTLKNFAQHENLHAVIIAHPTKLRPIEPGEDYPPVRPWDISGSAHWYNHADAIVSVWRSLRDPDRVGSGEVEIHVSKIRFAPECGSLGMARLYFDRVSTRYHETPRALTRKSAATDNSSHRQQQRELQGVTA
jgi:DnaB-like helicase C terminal domain